MATIRQQRVAGLLFEELSIMLNGELSDPRVSLITVMGVQLSKDLRNAKVHIYHQNEEFSRKEVLAGLRSATPYLRSQLASRCGLRMVPEILFYYDDTPERAARIDELLSQIAQNARRAHRG
ncbi:MAG: 30S ribosome-binding factor RbfA [Caldilineaceae bacterium]|nr:30S ribosome-binding factor RbfA [Caldilineaceae bacterium]